MSPGTACIALKRNIVIDFNDSVKGTLNEIIQKQRNVSRYVCVLILHDDDELDTGKNTKIDTLDTLVLNQTPH